MPEVTMNVNGRSRSGSVEGRTLLSGFLRDHLGLTGTHVGCDTSQCGACVVLVDGAAVKACTMLAAEAQGAGITEATLATTIIAKSEAFLALIGVAAGLRAQGRTAVMAATDDAVPLDQVEARVEAVFSQLAHQVQVAITQLQTPTAL